MRSVLLLLLLLVPASAQDVKPAVTLGSTALRGTSNVFGVFFSADSERVGIIGPDSLPTWSLADGSAVSATASPFVAGTTRFHVARDGRRILAFTERDGKAVVHTRDMTANTPPVEHKLPDRLDAYLVSENARCLALEKNSDTTIVNLDDPAQKHEFPGVEHLRRFSASSDGRVFAFCNRDGKLDVRAAGTGSWMPAAIPEYRFASVALSPDGKLLATACFREDEMSGSKSAGPIEVWSLSDRNRVALCEAVEWFAEYPNRLRFSPDGKQVFAGDGAYIRGWNTTSGKRIFAVEPGWNYPGALTISPDGKYIAVAYATRAMVWDITTGKPPRGFEGHPASVWEIVFSADGKRAATASYGLQQVLVWDPQTGRVVSDLNVPYRGSASGFEHRAAPPNGIKNNAEGDEQAWVGKDGEFRERKSIIPGRIKMALSANGASLATFNEASGSAGPLRVWDTPSQQIRWEKSVDFLQSPEFAFLDAGILMVPSPLKKIDYFDAVGVSRWNRDQIPFIKGAKIDPAGCYVALESLTGFENWIVNAKTGRIDDRFDGVPYAFSPDGKKLIVLKLGPTMTDGRFVDLIITRDIASKKDITSISVPMGTLKGRLSPDATVLADDGAASRKEAFAFRDLATNRIISTAARVDHAVHDLVLGMVNDDTLPHSPGPAAFSPDGRLFAVAYKAGQLAVWDIASGETLFHTFTGCMEPRFVTFNPDGRTVFITSGEGAGSPVYGYDCTGGARDDMKPADKDLPALLMELKGKPAAARRAIHQLARRPDKVVALSKAITDPATEADAKNYDMWIVNLDAAAFRDRETATVSLFNAGWRAEAKLQAALATTRSEEVRERLQDLLSKPDYRRNRVVHLLELTATPEAKTLLGELATSKDATTAREAIKALARMP